MLTPEQRRIVWATVRWCAIREAVGLGRPDPADVWHSALLERLIAGHEPLQDPPPLAYGYPWYALIEQGLARLRPDEVTLQLGETPPRVIVCGHGWHILAEYGPAGWVVTYDPPSRTRGRWVLVRQPEGGWEVRRGG